jgi:hypothetical protein
MHPNMKNFYDLLDIKKPIGINLKVIPIIDVQAPRIKIQINELVLYEDELKQKISLEHKIKILETLDIKIELFDKNYGISKDTGIIIESLKINFFEVVPKFINLATYKNNHDIFQATKHLEFNGTWNLQINEPFYRWKHRITGQGWLLQP